MNIECERLQEQYSDFFEHALTPAEVTKFEKHLATCEECRSDYHTFATMFQFLDRVEVAEVEAPSNLRAEILTVISQKPVVRTFRLRDWIGSIFARPQLVWGGSLAAAAVLVVIGTVLLHAPTPSTPSSALPGSMLGGSAPLLATAASPLLQNVALKEGSGNLDYEVFTLHTPPAATSTANVSAYVLQDGDPIIDAAAESDSTKATPAWSGTLDPNVSLTLPVAVTSDLPAGTSLNLLLDWSAQNGSASGREVAFVPITPAASSPTPVADGSSFYDAIRTIAGEYQQTIVADSSALSAIPKLGPLSGTTGNELNAEQALQSVLSPDGFAITVQPGGYYLVSHP